jgi:hypothetical protein
MGPSEDRSTGEKNQAGHRRIAGSRRRARRPRSRACLLKGCERRFRPMHPLRRYCSEECREEARRWREWKARHHYRQSEGGKQKRRAQSRRYRLRSKRARAANQGPRRPREGHRKKKYFAAPAIGLAATRNSSGADARPCSDFVRTPVAERWSEFWSENGVGGNDHKNRNGDLRKGYPRTLPQPSPAEMVLRYCASSGCRNKFGMPKQKRKGGRSPG